MARKLSISVGDTFKTKKCGVVKVLLITSSSDITVEFDNGLIGSCSTKLLKSGGCTHCEYPNIFGKGYLGKGDYKTSGNDYMSWYGIMRLCYEKQDSCSTVDERWHNFQNFAYDISTLFGYSEYLEGDYVLEKSFFEKINSHYSLSTCYFVPNGLANVFNLMKSQRNSIYPIGVTKIKNGRFIARFSIKDTYIHIGTYDSVNDAFFAYKGRKETHIKELAEKYKDRIDPKVYNALLNYTVEITD